VTNENLPSKMENPASSPNQVALGVQPEITNTPKEKNLKTPQKQREQALAYYYANREAIRNRYNNYSDEKRKLDERELESGEPPINSQGKI